MMETTKIDKKREQEEDEDKKRRRWLLLLLLLLLLLITVCTGIWALRLRKKAPSPDYASPDVEANAEVIDGDETTKLESPDGGGSVSLTYSRDVSIDLSDKKASLLFANPSRSNQDAAIQLVIGDNVIIRSGTLSPGHQVTTLDLSKDAEKQLSAGSYEGKFVVSFYDRQSHEKAMINTEIPVTVTVVT